MKAVNINILDKFLDKRDVTNVCGENLIFFNERRVSKFSLLYEINNLIKIRSLI
jgi:hypothetical protein